MAEFLSPEWIAELDEAAAASSLPAAAEGRRLIIEQRVQGAPANAEVCYHLVIDPARARVAPGAAELPDATVITDYETARALHEGRTTAQAALIAGRYKLRGRLTSLRMLAELDDVFRDVRARTTFR
jgi:hypothetical protein